MKTTQSILSQFEKTSGIWLASLNKYSEEQFTRKSDANSWSIGQVYSHLVAGTRLYHLQQIAQCLDGRQIEQNGKMKFPGKIIFFLGSFPPTRIKVSPSKAYTPKQPPNIMEMKAGLTRLIEMMQETEQKLCKASEIPKTAHPALGFLNAREWFQLIEMHFRHHLRQKERIERFLSF